jgi:hypothetical protein
VKLIDDFRCFTKFWSVRLAVIGSTLTAALIAFPEIALSVWTMMPGDLRSAFPEKYMPLIGVGIFVLSIIARAIKQERLAKKDE